MSEVNTNQPYVQNANVPMTPQPDLQLCEDIRKTMSSNLAMVAAILSAMPVLCMILSGMISKSLAGMVVLAIPSIATAIEAWVTFGTAKWSKSGIKTGGLVLGKVFSHLNIIGTVIMIIGDLIAMVAWSFLVKAFGESLDKSMTETFGSSVGFSEAADKANNMMFLFFLVAMIPLVVNIVLQGRLNRFRNKLIDATEDKLVKRPKTLGLAIMMFIVGLPILIFAVAELGFIGKASPSNVLFVLAILFNAAMYFCGGVLVISFGKGR